MRKTNLPTVEDYKKWIQKALTEKSHSGKPHLSNLPYDLRITDLDKLQERVDACDKEIENWQKVIDSNKDSINDFNRIINSLEEDKEKLKNEVYDTLDSLTESHWGVMEQIFGKEINKYVVSGTIDSWYRLGYGENYKKISPSLNFFQNKATEMLIEKLRMYFNGNPNVTYDPNLSFQYEYLLINSYSEDLERELKNMNEMSPYLVPNETLEYAKELTTYGDKFKNTLNEHHQKDNLIDSFGEDIDKCQKDIENAESMVNDYSDEKKRTQNHIEDVKNRK